MPTPILNANSLVHVILFHDGARWYLQGAETARNQKGEIYLRGSWNSDPAFSKPWVYETAGLIRERLKRESNLATRIALSAGENVDLIEEPSYESRPEENNHEPVIATLDDTTWYVVQPTHTPSGSQWFLVIALPELGRTVIYAESPLEVLRRAEAMNWLRFAEKYESPPQPLSQQQQIRPRARPGDL